MGCNCKYIEIVLGLVIIVFAWWQVGASQWIITVAAALLILHALKCDNCSVNVSSIKGKKKGK